MAYDWTTQPEAAGPATEYLPPADSRYPEAAGPSPVSGTRADADAAAFARIGPIPHLLDTATRNRERAAAERRGALLQQVEQAALTAARDSLSGQFFRDAALKAVDAAITKTGPQLAAAAAEPAPDPEPEPEAAA